MPELDYYVRIADPREMRENPIPYGENDDTSSGYFIERKKFKESAYADIDASGVVDMLGNRVLFGRVDLEGDAIIPKKDKDFLSFPNNDTNEIFTAFNFVATAFENFRRYYNMARIRGLLISGYNSKIYDLQPFEAYDDPNVIYDNHLQNVSETLPRLVIDKRKNFLKANQEQLEVKNFDHFMSYFENTFVKNGLIKEMPITKGQYVKSRFCSIRSSGLIIELDNADHGVDIEKYQNYITDVNFEFYVKTALKFGFRIDKNAPWRLVPDFNSDVMKDYMLKFGISSLDNLFSDHYEKVYQNDLDFLKNLFFNSYNKLLEYQPILKENKMTCNKTISRLFKRRELKTEEFSKNYEEASYWVSWYVKIRLNEMSAFSVERYRSILNNYAKVKNLLDKGSILRYINRQINSCQVLSGNKLIIGTSTQKTY